MPSYANRGHVRTIVGVLASAALVTMGLTACSSAVDDDCVVHPGQTSDLVSVSGDLDKKPDVDFPTPLKTEKTERSTIVEGSGPALAAGQRAQVMMSLYNGNTGDVISQSDYSQPDPVSVTLNDQAIPGLTEGLRCAEVGSRVVLTIDPDDAFGPQGGNPMIGLGPKDTLVVVADIVDADLLRADGRAKPVPAGFPHVVLAPNGQPGITVPDHEAPTELKVATRLKGDGEKVERGDAVTVNYTGVLWKDGTVFDSSWERGAPATFLDEDGSKVSGDSPVSGIIPGLADALEGASVGSQLIAVIPPDQAYGSDGQGSVPGDATLVFVVDVLGID